MTALQVRLVLCAVIVLFLALSPGEERLQASYLQKAQQLESEEPSEALNYYNKALLLQSTSSGKKQEPRIREAMSKVLLRLGMSKNAFSQLLTADSIYKKTGDTEGRVRVLAAMASFCEGNGVFSLAEKYYSEGMTLQESLHLPTASTALNLTGIYIKKGEYEMASGFIVAAVIDKYPVSGNEKIMADAYLKLAEIRRMQKLYTQAENLVLKKSLPLYQAAKDKTDRIGCFNLLGLIYREQKRYSEAKWFFIQENIQARALNNIPGIIMSLVNLAKVKIAIGDAGLAVKDLREAERLSGNANDLLLLAEVSDAWSVLYRNTGKSSASFSSSSRSSDLRDSVKQLMLARAESVYNAHVIIMPAAEKPVAGKKAKVVLFSYYWLLFVLIIIVVLFFIWILYYRKKKRNKTGRKDPDS